MADHMGGYRRRDGQALFIESSFSIHRIRRSARRASWQRDRLSSSLTRPYITTLEDACISAGHTVQDTCQQSKADALKIKMDRRDARVQSATRHVFII